MFGTTSVRRSIVCGLMAASCTIATEDGALLPDASGSVTRPLRMTLEEAQNRAEAASKTSQLAELNTKAARYRRQATQSDYFPKIGSSFANLHFNKLMGQRIQVRGRDVALPLLSKDQTVVAVTATQPITPILKIREAVHLARADERIAEAKAASISAKIAAEVQLAYFKLLITQRQHQAFVLKVALLERQMQVAGIGTPPPGLFAQQSSAIEARKALLATNVDVASATESLNILLGLPLDTELELTPPPPLVEEVSPAQDPNANRMIAANATLVEAEQGVAKARAASRLAKLEYVPDVAVIGGYTYQNAVPLLPRDFSFIGILATWNIFDFGKRERLVSERRTQVQMAEANLELVRQKAAAEVQKSYLDLHRARRLYQLTRQVALAYGRVPAGDPRTAPEPEAARVQAEAEMLQADLDYRLAHAEVMRLVAGR